MLHENVMVVTMAGLVALGVPGSLIGCGKKSAPTSGSSSETPSEPKKASNCDDFESCEKACSADEAAACIKVGDFHRRARNPKGKFDEAATLKAYQRACDAKDWLGCAKLGEMRNDLTWSSRACQRGVELGCVICTQNSRENESCKSVSEKDCDDDTKMIYCTQHAYSVVDNAKRAKLWEKSCSKGEFAACRLVTGAYEKLYSAAQLNEFLGLDRSADYSAVWAERAIQMLTKACDEGLAKGWDAAEMSCVEEAQAQLQWLNAQIPSYMELPIDKRDAQQDAKRAELKKDKDIQKRVKRIRDVLDRACKLGDEMSCGPAHASYARWLNEN